MADSILDSYRAARPDLASVSDQDLIKMIHDASGVGGSTRDYARNYLGIKNNAGLGTDTAIDIGKGLVGIGQIATGAANLASGGAAGNAIRNTFGGDLEDVKHKMDGYYSDARQDADANVQNAQGFWGTAKALVQNPRALVGGAVESLPSMLLPGGVAGKVGERVAAGGLKAAEGLAPMARAAATREAVEASKVAANRATSATWAGMTATQTADKVNHASPDDPQAMYGAALGAGAVVGGLTHGFSFIPGGHMADQAATTAKRMGLSVANQAGMMGSMGAAQTGAENLATGKPFDQGMAEAVAGGMVNGIGFGLMGGRKRPDVDPRVQVANDAAAKAAVGDTDFQTKWTAWAQQMEEQRAAQPPATLYTNTRGETMPPEALPAYHQFGNNPVDIGTGAGVEPQKVVDPAAQQLADVKAKNAAPQEAVVTQEERNAVFAKHGDPRPNYIGGKLDQHGQPLAVGHHFDVSAVPDKNGNVRPFLSPEKLQKAVDAIAVKEREKPEAQRAAEQQLSDVMLKELGRRPTSRELDKITKTIDLPHAASIEQLVGHIDVALAGMEGSAKPDTLVKDSLTAWRKALDDKTPSHAKVAEPVKEGEAPTTAPVETPKPMEDHAADVLKELITPQPKPIALPTSAGTVKVVTKADYAKKMEGWSDREKQRVRYLLGVDEEGNQIGHPLTHAQITAIENAAHPDKQITDKTISAWAARHGITQEAVDKVVLAAPETASPAHSDEIVAHAAEGTSGLHVVDNAGDIHKGGLGGQDMTAMQQRQQQVADDFMHKNGGKKAAEPAAPTATDLEIEQRRKERADQERLMFLKQAEASPNREVAANEFRMMRRKGDARFEELTDEQRAEFITAYDLSKAAEIRGEDGFLEDIFHKIQQEVTHERSNTEGRVPSDSVDLGSHPVGPDGGQPLQSGDAQSGGEVRQPAQPAVTVKRKRTLVKEASGARNPDIGKMTPLERTDFKTAAEAAQHIAETTKDPLLRHVAEKILPFLKDVDFRIFKEGDMVDRRYLNRFYNGSMGLAILHEGGRMEVGLPETNKNSMTHEIVLHELVHAATMKRMQDPAIRADIQKLADTVAAEMRRHGDEFFHQKQIFGDADEFMAYGLTSPTFQTWMKQMDASGRVFSKTPYARTQAVPKYTMWQKFVDTVRRMFGLPETYKAKIEQVVAANTQEESRVNDDKLETSMKSLLDKVLSTEGPQDATPKEQAASASLPERRETIAQNIDRLPVQLRKPVRGVMATIHDVTIKGAQAGAFMHDLADWGNKHGLPAMKKIADVMAIKGAYKVEKDQKLGSVVGDFQKLAKDEQDNVQRFLKDSTFEQKWGYQPSWRGEVKVDEAAKKQYEALSPAAQKVADNVFRHNYEIRQEKQRALEDIIQTHYTEMASRAEGDEVAALWKRMESELKAANQKEMEGPYVPLKRFGSQVVTVKSKALLEAKETDGKQYREMLDDPDHYRVEHHDSIYAAENRRAELEQGMGGTHVVERSEKEKHEYLGAGYETLAKLADSVKSQFDGADYTDADKKLAHATYRAINEAIIQSLGEYNARTSSLQRKYIAGVDYKDMMRGFATQGYADNNFLAAMKHNKELQDHTAALRAQVHDGSGDRTMKQSFYNELQARRAANMGADTPRWIGHAMRFTTLWKLITSPAYYLQYLSQPLTMFLPLVNGDHGYGAGNSAFAKAVADTAKISKGLYDTDLTKIQDAGERKMLETLRSMGTISIGHEQQFGQLQMMPEKGFSKVWQQATQKITQLPHSVEMHNRIASALAAYRLEMAKHGDAEKATAYAKDKINEAYGDYSSYNAPRIMQGGGVTKLVMQYRQFQLIHTALLTRLLNNAFAGASPEEKRAARLQLTYMAGHYGVLAGALGVPAAHVVGGAIKAVFGDENDEDVETFVNRHTGNKFMADMILGGVPRAVFGQDLSSRMGAGDILSPFRYADMGSALTDKKSAKDFTVAALGPAVGMALQMVDGVDMMGKGDYYRGMEQLMPKGIGDVMKAYRFAEDGVVDKKGQTIVDKDAVSTGTILGQALGSRPTQVADPQHEAAVVSKIMQRFKDEENTLKSQFIRTRKEGGDTEAIMDKWRTMQDGQRKAGIKPSTMGDLYKSAATGAKRDRMVIDGVPFRKNNRALVQDITGGE